MRLVRLEDENSEYVGFGEDSRNVVQSICCLVTWPKRLTAGRRTLSEIPSPADRRLLAQLLPLYTVRLCKSEGNCNTRTEAGKYTHHLSNSDVGVGTNRKCQHLTGHILAALPSVVYTSETIHRNSSTSCTSRSY